MKDLRNTERALGSTLLVKDRIPQANPVEGYDIQGAVGSLC